MRQAGLDEQLKIFGMWTGNKASGEGHNKLSVSDCQLPIGADCFSKVGNGQLKI
jgi:hypothetical protein